MINFDLQRLASQFAEDFWGMEIRFPVRFMETTGKAYGQYVYRKKGKTFTPVEIRISNKHGLQEPENRKHLESVLKHELCHWYCQMTGKSYKDGSKDFEAELLKRGAMSTRFNLFKEESWEKSAQQQAEVVSGKRNRLGDTSFKYYQSGKLRPTDSRKLFIVFYNGIKVGELYKYPRGKYQWAPLSEYHEFPENLAYLTRKGASEALLEKAREGGILS